MTFAQSMSVEPRSRRSGPCQSRSSLSVRGARPPVIGVALLAVAWGTGRFSGAGGRR